MIVLIKILCFILFQKGRNYHRVGKDVRHLNQGLWEIHDPNRISPCKTSSERYIERRQLFIKPIYIKQIIKSVGIPFYLYPTQSVFKQKQGLDSCMHSFISTFLSASQHICWFEGLLHRIYQRRARGLKDVMRGSRFLLGECIPRDLWCLCTSLHL